MSKKNAITRYSLIIKKLRYQHLSFEEIKNYLEIESEITGQNFNISKRTFHRDIDDIKNIYNIDIVYDFSQKTYRISSEDNSDHKNRLLEAFNTFNALNLSGRLSHYIHFEQRKPSGIENFNGILYAIENNFTTKFKHHKYWERKETHRTVEPYALKEFKHLWYMIAKDLEDGKVKSFALDRINDLDITKWKFDKPNDFNIDQHYEYCFGITSPNNLKLEEIILEFTTQQGKYIKALPIHKTQEIIKDTENELTIKLKLYITHDLIMEILSYGETVKVVKPTSLAKNIKNIMKETLSLYEKE